MYKEPFFMKNKNTTMSSHTSLEELTHESSQGVQVVESDIIDRNLAEHITPEFCLGSQNETI